MDELNPTGMQLGTTSRLINNFWDAKEEMKPDQRLRSKMLDLGDADLFLEYEPSLSTKYVICFFRRPHHKITNFFKFDPDETDNVIGYIIKKMNELEKGNSEGIGQIKKFKRPDNEYIYSSL